VGAEPLLNTSASRLNGAQKVAVLSSTVSLRHGRGECVKLAVKSSQALRIVATARRHATVLIPKLKSVKLRDTGNG